MARHFLQELRTTFGDRSNSPALTYRGRDYSYSELDKLARRWAAWLQHRGVASGARVVLVTEDKFAFLIAHLGTLFAGCVSVPLNPRFTAEEIRYFLTDSGASVAVAAPDQVALLEGMQTVLPSLSAIVADAAVFDAPSASYHEPRTGADDACLIIYSSGTTGWPKGVVHTHANVAASLRALQKCWQFTPDDAVVNVLPLFHPRLGLCHAPGPVDGRQSDCRGSFHPLHALGVIWPGARFHGCSHDLLSGALDEPEFRTAARSWRVRLFTCGSAPIRPEVLPELEGILGRPVINRYGMTEAFVISSLPLAGPWPQGSVGLPLEGIELRIAAEDSGSAAPGGVGTVLIRGPNLFREYWGKPDATRTALATGWFDTGDLGALDAAGFLTLAGRKNDLIITNRSQRLPAGRRTDPAYLPGCLGSGRRWDPGLPSG